MRFTLAALAAGLGGRTQWGARQVDGVAIDSRRIRSGVLFVPLVAERDGHEFAPAAVAAGAAAYLTARGRLGGLDAPYVEVPDTAAALAQIGRLARARLPERVVGITGSVGKTSTKDLAAAALAAAGPVGASEQSFNNELGVPLTLANAPDDAWAVVVEMGARGGGHIAELCRVARPTVGVVTRVAMAHTELFGSLDAVAEAKGELVEALPASGVAVLNADDARVAAMAGRCAGRVLRFGRGERVDVGAEDVALDAELRPAFKLVSPWGSVGVRLAVRGEHQVMNALAAAAAALCCGAELDAAAAGLGAAELSPWRMQLQRSAAGALVLNDAYNANPESMRAALAALAALPARRRVAVLGGMAELGPAGPSAHRDIAALAAQLGVELLAVGTELYGVAPAADPVAALGPLGEGDAVLVKASRAFGLEQVAAVLVGAPA